jgi:glyceraldehyde 3-phosphate dehydrogenase
MTRVRIGLMGFGRIGRNVFRLVHDHPSLEVGAIADITDPAGLTYLLKYDSLYGRFPAPLELADGSLFVDGGKVPFLDAREPGDAPWSEYGVDIVVQATGSYQTSEWCEKHLEAGAKKVILASTPESWDDIPTLLRGINDDLLDDDPAVVALGSNTSNALAPILKVIDNSFGIDRAFFTTVHAMTNSQRLADVPSSDFRQSRAAAENIIPSDTNSADILAHVMPEFEGKLSGVALNVPVSDGSTVDLVAEIRHPASPEAVNAAVRTSAQNGFSDIIEYASDPIVSSDVRDSMHSGVFDSLATMVMDGTMVKTITWFNNGWGYSARLLEVAARMASSLGQGGTK